MRVALIRNLHLDEVVRLVVIFVTDGGERKTRVVEARHGRESHESPGSVHRGVLHHIGLPVAPAVPARVGADAVQRITLRRDRRVQVKRERRLVRHHREGHLGALGAKHAVAQARQIDGVAAVLTVEIQVARTRRPRARRGHQRRLQ